MAVTWDPATITAVTLSGGNLVATNTGTTSADQGARVANAFGKTSGKYYFEITFTTFTSGGNNRGVGVGTTSSTYTGMGNTGGVTGVEFYRTLTVWSNGSNIFTFGGGAYADGQVAALAIDLDNRRFWLKKLPSGDWNDSAANNPATNVGGLTIPAGTMVPFVTFGGTGGTSGNVVTANFGASAFVGTVPSGFISWEAGSAPPAITPPAIRIKHRAAGGAAGAPTSLANGELAYNEQDDTLYYGKGDSGAGVATSIIAIGGAGSYQPLDGDLTALAALTGTNTIYYRSGVDTWSPVNVSTGLAFSGGNLTATGGGGTPGGSNTQVQFNNSGAFGGSANFVWNNTTNVLTVTGQISVALGNATSIVTGGVIEAGSGFKQSGSIATLAPASAGSITLRPNGFASAAGQVQINSTGAVIINGNIELGATDTTLSRVSAGTVAIEGQNILTAATGAPIGSEYITSTSDATLTSERVLTDTATVTWDRTTAGQIKANAVGGITPGARVLITTVTISTAVATVDFTSGIDSTYDEYEIRFFGVRGSADTAFAVRISQDGGSTWKAGSSDYQWSANNFFSVTANNTPGGSAAATFAQMGSSQASASTAPMTGIIRISQPSSATMPRKPMSFDGTTHHQSLGFNRFVGAGAYWTDANAINGYRILPVAGGTITSGTFNLYGIKK